MKSYQRADSPHRYLTAVALLAWCAASGCHRFPFEVAPVAGSITLDGKPLAEARINTQPIATKAHPNPGPGSFAVTDEHGRYRLELVSPPKPGAVVGTHSVRISKITTTYVEGKEDTPNVQVTQLPGEALRGELQLVVPSSGADTADFHLKSS